MPFLLLIFFDDICVARVCIRVRGPYLVPTCEFSDLGGEDEDWSRKRPSIYRSEWCSCVLGEQWMTKLFRYMPEV